MSFAEKLLSDEFVWDALVQNIQGRARQTAKGFLSFNCPMCVRRGEKRADRQRRCGLKRSNEGIGINCFNCGLKIRWKVGDLLSRNMREFMQEIGIPEHEVKVINHKAFQIRSMIERSPEAQALVPISFQPNFPYMSLPEKARPITELADEGFDDPDFIDVAAYLIEQRGEHVFGATTYYWSPEETVRRRLLVPFFHQGKLVGYTARAIDAGPAKYLNFAPTDYVFNNHFLYHPRRRYVPIVEGIFDALAIDGISPLGANISDKQAAWINGCGKIPIYVHDRDKAGVRGIEVALRYGWPVAFPRLKSGITTTRGTNWWADPSLKDADAAVAKYGRLYVMRSIFETMTTNKLEIRMKAKVVI